MRKKRKYLMMTLPVDEIEWVATDSTTDVAAVQDANCYIVMTDDWRYSWDKIIYVVDSFDDVMAKIVRAREEQP